MSPYTGPWTTCKVRKEHFDFFESRGHTFVSSSPVVPDGDPTRLFANAGMNQFRPIFLGTVNPQSDMGQLKRAYNSQKCIRMGDLEDVGKDSYHHSFFEMLGNWSFGDYFKREGIAYAWELLTEVYKIPKDRLYVTYFEGDEQSGLAPDEETRQILLNLGVAEDHILTGSAKDNFWDMDAKGGTGPCGPCSEIHVDRIGGRNAAHLVNKGDPDVIEVWNNVFIQFNRKHDGTFEPLPENHVDSAVGLERLASVVQGGRSNYDLDHFMPILHRVHEISGVRLYQGNFGGEDQDGIDTAYRVVADHVRTLVFSLSDGGLPGDVGRGYAIRQILRRGLWFARKKLDVSIRPFFSLLLPTVVEHMGAIFPELTKRVDIVKGILNAEEESFSRTLDDGQRLLDQYTADAKRSGANHLGDEDVWSLYNTYGFPISLTRLIAEERGLRVKEQECERTEAGTFVFGW